MINFNSLVGGWSKYEPVTATEKAIFDSAMSGLVGVDYEPLIYSSQIVSGTNYKFICNAKTVTPDSQYYLAQVLIYAPLPSAENNKPVLVSITPIA